jgi:glycosyltransferase involved in cell wall biosynthesis
VTSETTSISVVHVAPTAFGHGGLFGGGERYPLELARAIARIPGVSCRLVTFGDPASETREEGGLRVQVLAPVMRLRSHPAHPLTPRLLGALRGADVIHTHHLRSTPSRMAAVAARVRRSRIVVTDHGLGGSDWLGVLPRLFDRHLAVSEYSRALLRMPRDKSRVVYGGADVRRFAPDGGVREGVLFVGRLTPHKGVDRLIRALPDGATLTIVGTGGHDAEPPERDYPEHLRALARGRAVRFLDAVDDDRLAALYRRAAVVAVPSVHTTCYGRPVAVSELLGLTAIEAMASGAPVVASRVGGLPEIVTDGVTGRVVDPGDVGHLHAVLGELLSDRARACTLGRNARAIAQRRFSWDACARRCVDAYRELLT